MKLGILLFFLVPTVFALPLDAKFLARILGSSDSKRTLLVNRGSEHGVREGDHAKISSPTGMVARGIVVKVSPGRSVWSIYRFFQRDKLQNAVVYTFKISEPVKLTSDETKTIGTLAKQEIKKQEKIPVAELTVVERKNQKKIKQQMFKTSKTLAPADGVDYSGLEDHRVEFKRNNEVDWSELDEKSNHDQFANRVDYSSLQ